jgi:energy-coupling factor transporter ATP-binding protein EcfA2
MTHNTFFSLLKIGIGGDFFKYFMDYKILTYVLLDSFIGYLTVNITNRAINNITIFQLALILFLPLCSNLLTIMYNSVFLEKKVKVIDNILAYIKQLFLEAPNEFHEKFDIHEKYNSFSSSIWGYDHVIQLIINMISSLIKIITISLTISYNDKSMGLLIICSNLIMLYIMPKINKKIETMKHHKVNYKELYSSLYYETVIYDELRTNPILNKIHKDNINSCLSNIILKYSNRDYYYEIGTIISNLLKNVFLFLIFTLIYYQGKTEYILILLLNKNIIYGFSDIYAEFKQTENNSKKRMEELFTMLDFLNDSKENNVKLFNQDIADYKNITIQNLDYNIFDSNDKGKIIKRLYTDKLQINFNKTKNIILINGKTGAGKSVLTKILAGFTNDGDYKIYLDDSQINGFSDITNTRIIIGQKVCEEYTYSSSIQIKLDRLYPGLTNIKDLITFLEHFNIASKLVEHNIYSTFSEKLSGGERQRVILSSMFWKVLKTNPKFIILDEPEKGIDEETMCEIMDYIIEIYKGTIFLITHNENIKKRYADKIQSKLEYKFDSSYDKEINTQIYQI